MRQLRCRKKHGNNQGTKSRRSENSPQKAEQPRLLDQVDQVHVTHFFVSGSRLGGGVAQTLLQRLGSQEERGADILEICLS